MLSLNHIYIKVTSFWKYLLLLSLDNSIELYELALKTVTISQLLLPAAVF